MELMASLTDEMIVNAIIFFQKRKLSGGLHYFDEMVVNHLTHLAKQRDIVVDNMKPTAQIDYDTVMGFFLGEQHGLLHQVDFDKTLFENNRRVQVLFDKVLDMPVESIQLPFYTVQKVNIFEFYKKYKQKTNPQRLLLAEPVGDGRSFLLLKYLAYLKKQFIDLSSPKVLRKEYMTEARNSLDKGINEFKFVGIKDAPMPVKENTSVNQVKEQWHINHQHARLDMLYFVDIDITGDYVYQKEKDSQ